jgi:hypothetical protein
VPERVPAEGPLILRDGGPAYHYPHRAGIEAVVQGADQDAAFDTLSASIGTTLVTDRTLGGLCDSCS